MATPRLSCCPANSEMPASAALVAHFFVFYFAVFSTLTPPVAVSALAATKVSGGQFVGTAIDAMKLMLTTFIIPFAFAYHPQLLHFPNLGADVIPPLLLVVFLQGTTSAFCYGYLFVKLTQFDRWLALALTIAGLALLTGWAKVELSIFLVIVFICANGNHKKWSESELRAFVGEEIFSGFWPGGQIVNHDCLEPSGLKHLGGTPSGCVVEHNRRFVEADLMIYVGQVMAHTWGGYTGTGAVIGMASTRSILSHHNHGVVNHPKTTTGDHRRMHFRGLKAEINAHIERATGKRIFYINWVGGSGGRMAGIFAGYSPEVEPPAWEAADRFSVVEVPQADVLVIGLAERFAYGSADNPLIAAIGVGYPPRVWLGDHVLRRGGVVIGMTPSTGEIDAETYPSYQEVIDLYAGHHEIHELARHQDEIAARPQYLERYTRGGAYHPIHPFWLLYACDYVLSRAGAVIMTGTRNPGAFRTLGMHPARSFEAAWKRARTIVGPNPVTVVAPTYWSKRIFKFAVEGANPA